VQSLLEKAGGFEIALVCPLHGPIWRKNIDWYVDKYRHWATYTSEENAVMIAYASVYGNTENAATILAGALADRGVKNIAMYDVSITKSDVIVTEAFRCSHLVFAATTYNAGIFIKMEEALNDIAAHKIKNRRAAIIENGSWAPAAGQLMREKISEFTDWEIIGDNISILSSVKPETESALFDLADKIAESLGVNKNDIPAHASGAVDNGAFFKMSYGLFLLTVKDGERDTGCIINSAVQLTDTPKRINIAVINKNYTNDVLKKTGVFNITNIKEDTPFKFFQNFGLQSGRDVDKFARRKAEGGLERSANGLVYTPQHGNAFFSCKVIASVDYGTHTLYTADVTEAAVINNERSATYAYYFEHIKPKPAPAAQKKKGWVCKICGYFIEMEGELPDDFVCPLCKHGKEAFERVE
jgi:flavin reductase (DIM6/NTAB) family NADH-FMN oxidoreductase RutF/flavodoxin